MCVVRGTGSALKEPPRTAFPRASTGEALVFESDPNQLYSSDFQEEPLQCPGKTEKGRSSPSAAPPDSSAQE